jgi:hypothetical protein
MAARDIAVMERARLREEQPRPEMDDDEILEAVHRLMTIPRYKKAMEELIEELLINKGETVAINLGLPFPLEDDE